MTKTNAATSQTSHETMTEHNDDDLNDHMTKKGHDHGSSCPYSAWYLHALKISQQNDQRVRRCKTCEP